MKSFCSIHIGDDSNVQDGVVVHALETSDEENRPVEKNLVEVGGKKYAVYIGNRVSLAHQAQVHGPASIGDVLEPGVRIVGVTIPDGRYVPLAAGYNRMSGKAVGTSSGGHGEEKSE